jgi:succinyl-CoA synthetase beta subunit
MKKNRTLTVLESLEFLKKNGFPTARFVFVKKEKELGNALKKTGFPCVLKAVSKKAVHKTEQNAVRLNIRSLEEAIQTFQQLKKTPGFEGTLVQEQLNGTELLIGSKKDIQFGSTIVFGLGGTMVELLKDVSIRATPISAKDAQQMMKDIQHQEILRGFRGKPKVQEKKLVPVLLKASKFIEKNSFQELDINPLIATKKAIVAVDARIVL